MFSLKISELFLIFKIIFNLSSASSVCMFMCEGHECGRAGVWRAEDKFLEVNDLL